MSNYIDTDKIYHGDIGLIMIFDKAVGEEEIEKLISSLPLEQAPEDIVNVFLHGDDFCRFAELCYGAENIGGYLFKYAQFTSHQAFTQATTYFSLRDFAEVSLLRIDRKALELINGIATAHRIIENARDAISAILQQQEVNSRIMHNLERAIAKERGPQMPRIKGQAKTQRFKLTGCMEHKAEQLWEHVAFQDLRPLARDIAEHVRI